MRGSRKLAQHSALGIGAIKESWVPHMRAHSFRNERGPVAVTDQYVARVDHGPVAENDVVKRPGAPDHRGRGCPYLSHLHADRAGELHMFGKTLPRAGSAR